MNGRRALRTARPADGHANAQIATAHGGRVWVESTLGEDSTFFLTLPTADTAAPLRAATVAARA